MSELDWRKSTRSGNQQGDCVEVTVAEGEGATR
jgi:hypothetical protein